MNSKMIRRFLLIFLFIYCGTTLFIIFSLQQNQFLTKDEESNFTEIIIYDEQNDEPSISFPFLPLCRWKSGYGELSEKMHAQVPNQNMILFSAYQDNRTGTPMVRIMAAVMFEPDSSKLWCHFSEDLGQNYFESPVLYYEMCENHLQPYGGWILSCNMPRSIGDGIQPCFVSIGLEYPYPAIDATLPILRIEALESDTRPQIDFGVCVPPLFGSVSKESIVQFVEMVQLLGASHVVFYNYSVGWEVDNVLSYYTSKNIVSVLPWDFGEHEIWYNGQSIAINDCLYRHMSTIKHIMFMDLDEFLIPHNPYGTTWADIVNELKSDSTCGYSFKSTSFSTKSNETSVSNNHPAIVKLKSRSELFSRIRNKVMVLPYRILEIGIHHVSRPWPDEHNYMVTKVDPSTAYIHHYRDCEYLLEICGESVEDTSLMDKYGKQLTRNFRKVLRNSEV